MFEILRNAAFAEEKSPAGRSLLAKGLQISKSSKIIESSTKSRKFNTNPIDNYMNIGVWGLGGSRGTIENKPFYQAGCRCALSNVSRWVTQQYCTQLPSQFEAYQICEGVLP